MRCIADNRHQAPRGRTPCTASCVLCVLLLSVLETDERNESNESWNTRKSGPLVSDLGWLREVFPLLAGAKQLVKSASTFLSAFRLLPRLEEVYMPWVYTPAATLRKIVVYQLAGWAGKWNAAPLTPGVKQQGTGPL